MEHIKCVDCHWLCARHRPTRQPFKTVTTQLREKLKQPDAWTSYSLSRGFDFRCDYGRESFNDYPRYENLDKIIEERECGVFKESDPRFSLDQMKQIEIQSKAITIHEKRWWKNPGFLIMLILAIIGIILTIVLTK